MGYPPTIQYMAKRTKVGHYMAKETKFGYGFLFAGVALPYLMEKAFGRQVAMIAAVACLFVAICLLVAGHLHEHKRIASKVIFVLIALAFLGAGFTGRAWWKTEVPPPDLDAVVYEGDILFPASPSAMTA